MASSKRARLPLLATCLAALALAGCSSSGVTTRSLAQPEQLTPLPSSQVASTNLPSLGDPPAGPVEPGLTGDPVLGGIQQPAPLGDSLQASGGVGADGSFVSLDSVGSVPSTPGRDLSGGLTIEKLLGGWTVIAGGEQCKLNLTYTAKTGTSRYRASTPACQMPALASVASWQLTGSQVQLFDENDTMIAALILSGNRFLGTLSGGLGISMVG